MVVEKENILRILEETKEALKDEDVIKLKELSNQTVHSSTISQDPSNVAVAVIVYSLSKIMERKDYDENKDVKRFYQIVNDSLRRAYVDLSSGKEKDFKEELKKIRKEISELSGELKKYIQDVFEKAKINKASRIYEHGISMEKTSKLLGITLWDLASYAGQRGDVFANRPHLGETLSTKERIKLAVDIFK